VICNLIPWSSIGNSRIQGTKPSVTGREFVYKICTKTHLRASGMLKKISGGFAPWTPRGGEGRGEGGRGGGKGVGTEGTGREGERKVCPPKGKSCVRHWAALMSQSRWAMRINTITITYVTVRRPVGQAGAVCGLARTQLSMHSAG
jgi:hypothetical protein